MYGLKPVPFEPYGHSLATGVVCARGLG
jgi:hypothetical protein